MAKRITVLAGHYGSGKTNIAVNLALSFAKEGDRVAVADLDIVNPYFRTKDSASELQAAGIRLISSPYANTNVDVPALPQEMYSVVDDLETKFVLDIGGDDRGALALGRLAPGILEENNFEMLLVMNFYRPLTRDVDSLLEVMREMEAASGMKFTGIVNNSNLGEETEAEHLLNSVSLAKAFSEKTGLPIVMTTARKELKEELKEKIPDLMFLDLQKKYY